ncbi:hypothetical protein [Streptomyces misionensis]|nr:hypothetical protein [Streptomyces misionensis]
MQQSTLRNRQTDPAKGRSSGYAYGSKPRLHLARALDTVHVAPHRHHG